MNNYINNQPYILPQGAQGISGAPYTNTPLNTGYQMQPYGGMAPVQYYYAQTPQTNFSNPVLGLYNNVVKPNIPVSYTLLGVQKTPYGDDIYLYKLHNGQKVAIMPKEGSTIVKTFVNSGSMNETDPIRGISHFIEHNLFNGSKNLAPGQFFKEVAKMGSSTNASTDYALTDYYIESALMSEPDLKKTIEMHADMVSRPLFPADMIEKEKGPVTSEISMVNDDMLTVAANDAIRNLFQIKSNSSNLVAGSISTVNSLNKEKVTDYYQRHYTPDNLTTVVVGDVDPEKTIDLISKNFTQKPVSNSSALRTTETLTPINSSVRADYKSPTDNFTSVLAAFAGPVAGDFKSNIAISALGMLLTGSINSRLTNALEPINAYADYQVQKVGLKAQDPQALIFQIIAPPKKEQEALDAFYSTIENLSTNPPTEREMQIIKNNLLKSAATLFQSSSSVCDTIGTSLIDGDFNSISDYKNAINALTPYDIQTAAKNFVDLNKASVAVVHPMNVSKEEIMANYAKSKYSMQAYNERNALQNGRTGAYNPINKTPDVNNIAASQISFGSRNITTTDVKEAILPDNTHVVLNDYPTEPCYLQWVLTSKTSVPKNPAASYVLTELLNNGTKTKSRDEFISDAEANGISFAADANGFQITLAADCLENGIPAAIDTMKDALFNPRFTEKDFQKVKSELITFISSLGKDTSDSILGELFGDYFAKPEQILAGLQNLTLNDVVEHYNDMMQNATSAVVVSAPFEKNKQLQNQVFSKINNPGMKFRKLTPAYTPIYNRFKENTVSKVFIDTEERNQAQIDKTYSFKMSGNIQDEVKFELLNTILGGSPSSRLFQDLREKQKLAYRVSSSIQSFEDTGVLTLSILSTTDDKKQNDIKYNNLQKSLDGFEAHVQKLMNEPVTEEELESAKMLLKQKYARQTELPASKTALLAMNINQPYGIKRMDEYVRAIDKMTPADIQAAACHAFSNKPVYSILASEDTINNQLMYLNKLGQVYYNPSETSPVSEIPAAA